MFACFGLKTRHRRLSPTRSDIELAIPLNGGLIPKSFTLTRTPPIHRPPTPHGTPLPKRSSLRKQMKRHSEYSDSADEYPVKAARPAVTAARTSNTNHISTHSEQLKKLEAELSARTAEVRSAKEESVRAVRGVEALTVLVHHLTTTYDAYSTPRLKKEVVRLSKNLTDAQLSVDESNAGLRRLEEELSNVQSSHALQLHDLHIQNSDALSALALQHQSSLEQTQEKYQQKIGEFTTEQENQRKIANKSHLTECERLDRDWKTRLDLHEESRIQATSLLYSQHSQKIIDLETCYKAKENELEESNERLLKEQTKLKCETRKLEDTLLSDKDHRLQAAKRVCGSLQQEVDSLKSVIEMRNTEIHKLRSQVVDREQMTDELESARDRIRHLQAKTEDLQAQMDTKSQVERSLHNEHRQLVESLQRELTASKRLSLENEELQWKLRQREELMSASMPSSTLDLVTMSTPPSALQRSLEGGTSTPPSVPRSPRIMSKSLHAKSSPLRCELTKRWSQLSHTQDDRIKEELKQGGSSSDRISIDSPPPSPCVKAVIEKSNSVSFILDLNDSLSDDSFLDLPPSPRPRSARTPTLQRRALQKSISDKNCSSLIMARTKDSNGFGHRWNGTPSNDYKVNGTKKNGINGKNLERRENGINMELNDSCNIDSDIIDSLPESLTPSPLNTSDHVVPGRRRCYSTSESSEGGEIERESPTGLSWTVPVHQSSSCPPIKRQGLEPPPLHLRQPEEDEYEEMHGEREFVEVVALGNVPANEALSNLLARTPTSSASPSDSELSQCGSRAELSTESEEETSEEDDIDQDDIRSTSTKGRNLWWVPQEGAGEAMIPEELLGQYQEVLGPGCIEKHQKNILKNHNLTSGPSSDSEGTPQVLQNIPLDSSWSEDVECDLTSSSEMQEL